MVILLLALPLATLGLRLGSIQAGSKCAMLAAPRAIDGTARATLSPRA